MKYAVIKHADIDLLCRHVNKLLQEGWVCQGGVAMTDVAVMGERAMEGGGYVHIVPTGLQSERHYAQAMLNQKLEPAAVPT